MKLKNLLLPIATIGAMMLAVVGCKPKGGDQPNPSDKTTITIQGAKSVEVGKVIKLQAKIVPANPSEKVSWESSDTNIATVNNGSVKGIKAGKATITASLKSGVKATHEVTVTGEGVAPAPAKTTIKLDATEKSLKVGDSFTLKATLDPADAKDAVTWESSASDVASVKDGKVTALKQGSATITAKLENGNKAECKVTVTAKEEGGDTPTPPAPGGASFKFAENPITITMGNKLDLSKKIEYTTKLAQGATVKYEEVKVETPNNDWKPLLIISATGEVTPNRAGECEVRVTRSDNNESITVKIIVKDKTFDVPAGSKIVVTGGDGTEGVTAVKVQAEMPFVLIPKVVGPDNKEIEGIEITRQWDTSYMTPDFTDKYKLNTFEEGDTQVTYLVKGTDLKTVVKVNISYNNASNAVYTGSSKTPGVEVGIE